MGAVHDEDRCPGTAPVPDALAEPSKLTRAAGKAAVSVPDHSEKVVRKRRSHDGLGHLRGPLKLVGGALASVAAIGAIAGGLAGYWNVWQTI